MAEVREGRGVWRKMCILVHSIYETVTCSYTRNPMAKLYQTWPDKVDGGNYWLTGRQSKRYIILQETVDPRASTAILL